MIADGIAWPSVGAAYTCPLCSHVQAAAPGRHYGGAQCESCREWPAVELWKIEFSPVACRNCERVVDIREPAWMSPKGPLHTSCTTDEDLTIT